MTSENKSNSRMLILFLAIAVSTTGSLLGRVISQSFFGPPKQSVEQQLVQLSQDLNKSCPEMMDEYTRLDATVASGKTLSFRYTIVDVEDEEILEAKDEIEQLCRDTVGTKAGARKMLDLGATLRYSYRNSDGKELFEYSINK